FNNLIKLAAMKPQAFQADVLTGAADALTGWRQARKPDSWDTFVLKLEHSTDAALRERARDLSVLFGDGRALDAVKQIALDLHADIGARKAALQTLIDNRAPDLQAVCERLLTEPFINSVAARGLATFDDPALGVKLVKAYRQFYRSERGQLLSVL